MLAFIVRPVRLFHPQDLNKRLSLPADIRIPDGYLEKLQLSSPPFDQPLSRRSRRASLVSEGAGPTNQGVKGRGALSHISQVQSADAG